MAEPTVWPVPFEAKAMFPAVLELARASACKDIAALVDREDYAAALALTEKTIAGPFLWRGALTNGYQQGFCLYALHGLLLEQHGEVVRAYRAYQNSRACFDDDAAMMAQPEPRLEVFAGIGRMCVEAGRYTDALLWLETVRIEGNDQPYLCALADRGLVRRAVEIGDYHDAITNYWDLQAALAKVGTASAPRSAIATPDAGLDTATNQPIRDAASFKYQVSSVNSLSRTEYRELAQLYFWTWRDREGFAQVLDGITLLGIDNDLGVRDPMVDCLLNNIMRADDDEIQRFYDLLGYAITQARALKGDEEYVTFLLNARYLLSQLCEGVTGDFNGNLVTVVNCIPFISCSNSAPVSAQPTTSHQPGVSLSRRQAARSRYSTRYRDEEDCAASLEDSLMTADLRLKHGLPYSAREIYSWLCAQATGEMGHIEYDGATLVTAASCGCAQAGVQIEGRQRSGENTVPRSAIFLVNSQHTLTNTVGQVADEARGCLTHLPAAHPAALGFIERLASACLTQGHLAAHNALCLTREHAHPTLPLSFVKQWLAALAAQDSGEEFFNLALRRLLYSQTSQERRTLFRVCMNTYSWASMKQLARFADRGAALLIPWLLAEPSGHAAAILQEFLWWRAQHYERQCELLEFGAQWTGEKRIAFLNEHFHCPVQPGHLAAYGESLLSIALTNEALRVGARRFRYRSILAAPVLRMAPYPITVSVACEKLLDDSLTSCACTRVSYTAVQRTDAESAR